jgi:RNA polymerase sigma-70 factor (ECF subfamily)
MAVSSLDDKKLIEALKDGNITAFDKVYYKYNKKLFVFSLKFLKDRHEVEDLIQKVFTLIWERREHLNPDKSVEGYLFKIVRNEIYDMLKLRIIREHYCEYILNDPESDLDDLEKKKMIERVFELVNNLPEKRAKIFRMSKEEGLTYKEIAEQLNISENTVDTQIRHSLNYLRKELVNFQKIILFLFP